MSKYRPDIDGLRAVAVVPVVLFHAGVDAFGGGFVGVDVFFVISGYLITSILVSDLEREDQSVGRFLLSFYERRIRRIFPAFFVVLLVTTILASVVLLPNDFRNFSQSVAAVALFASNILFWEESGYFDASAHVKPLLHTWSLAVEEQFYVVFPFLLLVLVRWLPERRSLVLLGCGLCSFAASVWAVDHWPDAAFYLAPLRAWELLTGVLLALGLVPPIRSQALREVSAAVGLALIAVAVFTFSEATMFPGASALFPCIGAALLIHAGAGGATVVGRLLSVRPAIFVGLISYSLYLWHWPLLVFARYWFIDELSVAETVGVVVLSVVMAIVSWRWIEQPFRRRRRSSRGPLFAAAGLATVVAFGFGVFGHLTQGWPGRLPAELVAEVTALEAGRHDRNPDRDRCHANDARPLDYAEKCIYGDSGATPRFAMWGDSYAGELGYMLGELAKNAGQAIRLIRHAGCPPVLSGSGRSAECLAQNANVLAEMVADTQIKTVFLVARYILYYGEDGDAFIDEFHQVVRTLHRADRRVIVIFPVPEYSYSIPFGLAMRTRKGLSLDTLGVPDGTFRERYAHILDRLNRIVTDVGVDRVDPSARFCADAFCRVYADGHPLYFDDDHLSLSGARYIAPLFAPYFAAPPPVEKSRTASPL